MRKAQLGKITVASHVTLDSSVNLTFPVEELFILIIKHLPIIFQPPFDQLILLVEKRKEIDYRPFIYLIFVEKKSGSTLCAVVKDPCYFSTADPLYR